ncbi:MAG: hypothetical protein IJF18_04050 [Oscillospiraceae bacterium]|nr:hypothetical protein [Oscillospiraceae bacterium]
MPWNWGTHFNGTMLMPKANGKVHWAITDFDNAMFKFITKGKWFDGVSVKGSKLSNGTQKLDNYYADKVIIGRDYQGGGADIDEKMVVAMGDGFECPPYIFKAFRNLYSNYELLMQSAEDASKTPVPFLIHVNWEHIMTKEKAVRYAQSRIEQEQKLGIPFGLTYEQVLAEIETFDYITEADAVEIQKNVDRFNAIMTARFQSGDYDKYYGYSKSKQNRKKVLDKIFKK